MDIPIKIYKQKILAILKKELKENKKILDVGCGDCLDIELFQKKGLDVYGIDIYKHENAEKILGKKFKLASIYKIPFKDNYFDIVFAHNVLHHIDEKKQRQKRHMEALRELKRVCKKDGKIIILEANRYNPLFYPHMVLLNKHDHFKQNYFVNLCKKNFSNSQFIFFEAHVYPEKLINFFKIYEWVMEKVIVLKPFRAYNLLIASNE